MQMSLILQNRQKELPLEKETRALLRQAAKMTLTRAGQLPFRKAEISLLLTDNDDIKELNHKYRAIDKATDVLSFPLVEDWTAFMTQAENDETVLLGDIIISGEKAIEQAKEYRHSWERELAFLFVHGLLHLLGYDHLEKKDEEIMCKMQEEILAELGLVR